jgi:hypothetical protein
VAHLRLLAEAPAVIATIDSPAHHTDTQLVFASCNAGWQFHSSLTLMLTEFPSIMLLNSSPARLRSPIHCFRFNSAYYSRYFR